MLPLIGGMLSRHPTAYRYLPESVATFPDENALAAQMESAGYVNVTWRRLTFGVVAIHSGEKPTGATATRS